eukprot:scaffold11920_cov86-Cylindrotheca_fusiformis.AAC.1
MVNFILAKNRVSKYYSGPWMILKRERLDYNKHLQYEFGELQHPLKIRALPMTDEVIQRVHQLAQRDGVRTLTFANRRSEPIHFPDADLAGVGDDDDDSDDSDYEDTTDTDSESG